MKLFFDEFDTKILKQNTYKLYLKENPNSNKLSEEIKKIKDGIIFCFSPFSRKNILLLENLGFNLVSIRNTYKLDLDSYSKKGITPLSKNYRILDKSQINGLIDEKNLIGIAKTIFATSRYNKDEKLDKYTALDIYINWVKNSLYSDYAKQAFVAFDKSLSMGIITIKIKEGVAHIDLLGVINNYQNQKLASHLLINAIKYTNSQKITDIFVVTEGENIPANIFYQVNDFIIQKIELVYHKHT